LKYSGAIRPFFCIFTTEMNCIKRIIPLFVVILVNVQPLNAQSQKFAFIDTIRPGYQTHGSSDSLDRCIGFMLTTLPGGLGLSDGIYQLPFYANHSNGLLSQSTVAWKQMRMAGVPHIGLIYSFGNRGTQYAGLEYQQAFGKKYLLNLDYTKLKSNAYLRNNAFVRDDLQLQFRRFAKVYSFQLKSAWLRDSSQLSGGVRIDSLVGLFGPQLLPVVKENAAFRQSILHVAWDNYINVSRDSSIRYGLYSNHNLHVRNRRYYESDTLAGIYDSVYIDAQSTRDQFQWSAITNGVGAFFENKNHGLKFSADHVFWRIQNLGQQKDTTELNLNLKYQWFIRNVQLSNTTSSNFVGAANELRENAALDLSMKSFDFKARVSYENTLPDYYIRQAFGNNYNWTNSWSKQQKICALARVTWSPSTLWNVYVSASALRLKNNFFFQNEQWIQSTENIQMTQVKMGGFVKWKGLSLQPEYTLSTTSGTLQLMPKHMAYARLMLKGGLFKAKRLKAYVGLDAQWVSSADRLSFMPYINTLDWFAPNGTMAGFTDLHAFLGFQIDVFRFFVRMEHIGYYWNDVQIQAVKGYPFAAPNLRFGVTWDFFN
jgi:hypothetical protein